MATVRTILAPDGTIAVDIELPPGKRCVEVDARLRAILAVLGAPLEGAPDDPAVRPPQPEAIVLPARATVGGRSR